MSQQKNVGIQDYFKNLYEQFNRDPDAIPVIRVEDRSNLGYFEQGHLRIENFTLIIVPGIREVNGAVINSNAKRVEIDLLSPSTTLLPYLSNGVTIYPTITIQEVFNILIGSGYIVSQVDPRFTRVAATIFAERDEVFDGRTYLSVATSVLWRLFMPIALEGHSERKQVSAAIQQLDLRLASGIWLNRIGELYGLSRYEDESDEIYRRRINFHVIHPHTNASSLSYMVSRLFGYSATISDTLEGEFFYTDDPQSLTYARGMRDIRRTPHGNIAMFTVYLDTSFLPDKEPDEEKFNREMGKNQWFYTDDPTSVTTDGSEESYGKTTPSGANSYKGVIDYPDLLLVPNEEERKVYRSIARYKAAGSRFIVKQVRAIHADDNSFYHNSSLFVPTTTITHADNSVNSVSEPSFIAIRTFDDNSPLERPNNFATRTNSLSYTLFNGVNYSIEKTLAYR